MEQARIVLTRVDNRLVHGQVGVTWTSSLVVDTIVVVDDEVLFDRIRQRVMESVAKVANVTIRFYSVEEFIQTYERVQSHQKLFLVVKDVHIVRQLKEAKIPIQQVNLGNMHFERGKVPINRKVYVNDQDIEDLQYLIEQETYVYFQDVPGSAVEKIDHNVIERIKKK